ncbi:MAG: aldehyde:ferredoxin oxidoreductase, partial [Candidatus Portnoybacteria bacterium CG09_land_8_20_14_0_10_44_13]
MKTIKLTEIVQKKYLRQKIKHGYAGQTLHVDISARQPDKKIEFREVTEKMKEIFTGGKGFCLSILWRLVNGWTKWDGADNALCVAPGPLGGLTTCPGAGKSIVTAISPLTGSVVDSNVGGHFGPFLKFAGFDALSVQGKSDKDT